MKRGGPGSRHSWHRRQGRRASSPYAGAAVGLLLAVALASVAGPVTAGQAPSNGLQTWNFRQARVTAAVQNAGDGGAGVIVAVVDTWVESTHPELKGRVLTGADCANKAGTCLPGPAAKDACGHGTHVAGTAAGRAWGIAPRATILPVRVLTYDSSSGECTGSTADVAAGINWATTHGADVINLSLAPEDADTEQSAGIVTLAVKNAVNQGVVVVFAAGNNDRPVTDQYNGRVLIVAATGPGGGLASYSQHGQGVTVAAPGGAPAHGDCAADGSDCVIAAWKGGGYAALAGTSMAAPHVSGLAALLLGQRARSSGAVVDRITATSRTQSGAGSGRIDAAAALGVRTTTSVQPPPRTSPTPPARTNAATRQPPTKASVRPAPILPLPTTTPALPSGGEDTNLRSAPDLGADTDGVPLALTAVAVACLAGLGAGFYSVARGRPVAD